jgi:glycosyltransferase involved in cell wall biosynthesis
MLELAAKQENIELFETVKKRSQQYSNITFLGPIPYEEVIPRTQKADAVICIVDASHPSAKVGIPSKLFDAMLTGRPIIVAEGMYSAELVQQLNCGIVAQFEEHSIREAIIKLRDNPHLREFLGRSGFKATKEKYNWEKQKESLIGLYDRL